MKSIFNLVMATCCAALGVVCAKKYAEKSYKKGYICGLARSPFIEVSKQEALRIIAEPHWSPKGCFWLYENGGYVGIDNRTHEAWTEEFKTIEECFDWLEGKVEVRQ